MAVVERQRIEVLTRAPLIELAGVEKVYRMGKADYRALRGVDLAIAAREIGGFFLLPSS